MESNTYLFEKAPIPKALASLAVPTIISQLIVMIYNLADTFFIGQTNDPYKVAATSMAYVLFFMLNAFANLFGIGGGSLISRLLGQKRTEDAKIVSSFSFYGTILVTAVYCLICFCFMTPILHVMGASENTLGFAKDYTLWVVVVGGILNIFLDPLFMFVIFPKGKEVTQAQREPIRLEVLL